jgi:hypothetical protein
LTLFVEGKPVQAIGGEDSNRMTLRDFENGRYHGWEGVGCCQVTCGRVYHGAHATTRLFPELERSARAVQGSQSGTNVAATFARTGSRFPSRGAALLQREALNGTFSSGNSAEQLRPGLPLEKGNSDPRFQDAGRSRAVW